METQARNLKQIPAHAVTEGDVIAFADARQDVTIERVTWRQDGRVGFHANDDTWSAFYDGTDTVQIIDRGFAGRRIKDDLVLAHVPGEIGSLWQKLCEAENELARKLLDKGPGIIVVQDDDGWYLEIDGQQLMLMRVEAASADGPFTDQSSRFDFDLSWVDLGEEDLRVYTDTVLRAVASFETLHFHDRYLNRTFVVGAHATSDSGDSPTYCSMKFNPAFVNRLQQMHALCVANQLSEVRSSDGPLLWGPAGFEEEARLRDPELVVTFSGEFWFTDRPKYANYCIESSPIGISEMLCLLRGNTSDVVAYDEDLLEHYECDHEEDDELVD